MKTADKKLEEKNITQLETNTSILKEKTLSQEFKEMPYSTSKIGQGFVMTWRMPKKEKK